MCTCAWTLQKPVIPAGSLRQLESKGGAYGCPQNRGCSWLKQARCSVKLQLQLQNGFWFLYVSVHANLSFPFTPATFQCMVHLLLGSERSDRLLERLLFHVDCSRNRADLPACSMLEKSDFVYFVAIRFKQCAIFRT